MLLIKYIYLKKYLTIAVQWGFEYQTSTVSEKLKAVVL